MIYPPIKVGIAGTHSTGKTTFLDAVDERLQPHNIRICRVGEIARRAGEIGFPILADHNYESTLWIMSECMRQEAEGFLHSDVILVDRPVIDALGYLDAALEISGRHIDPLRREQLHAIGRVHTASYDILLITRLDPNVPLGEGRDSNQIFRQLAARHIEALTAEYTPSAIRISVNNSAEALEAVSELVKARLSL